MREGPAFPPTGGIFMVEVLILFLPRGYKVKNKKLDGEAGSSTAPGTL
jgi:hypothetical protein